METSEAPDKYILYIFYELTDSQSVQEKSMESKKSHVIGRRIVLERQERISFETNERIYLNRLYQNPLFDAARVSSSSDDIEKIHRTRERVEGLSNQINFEIERLKEFNNSLNNKKDERLMTWDERFRANPPLTKQHGPRRSDDVSKPGSKEVTQKDVSPRKPPPKGISLNGLPPKGGPSPKELPNEFTPKGLPPKGPLPKESKEITQKITPSMRLPPKELPPKELTYILFPKKEIPAKGLPLKALNPKKPPPTALAAKETPPRGLPLKELNPRKPTTVVLPPKEEKLPPKGLLTKTIPPKGVPPKSIPPKGLPPKTIPPRGVPPKWVPPKTIPPKGLPPRTIPPKGVPPKTTPLKGLFPKTIPPKGLPLKKGPPKTIPLKGLPPKTILPKWVPPKTTPPKGVPPKTIPSKVIPPKTFPPKGVPTKGLPPKTIPSKEVLPKTIPSKEVPPKTIPPKDLPAKDPPAKRLPLVELPPKKTAPKAPVTRKAPPKLSTQKELMPEKPPPRDVTTKNPIPKEEPMQGILGDATAELAARISGGCCHCYCPCDQCCFPTFEGSCYIAADCNCNMGLGFNRGIQYGIPYCTARRRVTDLNTEEMCGNRCVGVSPDRKSSKQCSSTRDTKKSPVRSGRTSPANKMRNHEKLPLKKNCQSPGNIKQEKPKAPKKDVTKLDVSPIASPTKDQKIYVDERMYEDYLSLYYKENSKTDLLESPRPTPTYTRLQESSAKPPQTGGHRNSKEAQRASICRDSQERNVHQASRCFAETYPGPFRYEECFEEQDYRSPDNNRTEPVSDPHCTTPIDCRCPQPTESRAYSQHPKSTRSQDKDRQRVRPESVMAPEVPKNVFGERSSLARDWETNSTSFASLPVKPSTTTETQRSKERSSLAYPLHSSEKSTQVYNDRQSNLSSGPSSSRKAHSPTIDSRRHSNSRPSSFREESSRRDQSPSTDSRRQSNSRPSSFREESYRRDQSPSTDSRRQSNSRPTSFREGSSQMRQSPTTISYGANSSRIAPSQTSDSTCDTTVMNPHYQPEDSQFPCKHSSDEYDARFDMHMDVQHPNENTDFDDAFSTVTGKAVRSSIESPQLSFGKPMGKEFKDFQDTEMSEAEEPEEALRTTNDSARRQSQSKTRSMAQEDDTEYNYRYYSTPTAEIQSRCECNGYETARSVDSVKRGDESLPVVRTLCEKRTRTVTFKDEQGDLKRQRQVEEECRSHIDWEPALNDNYTSRSSSSAEHTCLESSCDEEDAYDSCFESPGRTDEQMHSFKACPCMHETYRQLAALCHTKSPYYR